MGLCIEIVIVSCKLVFVAGKHVVLIGEVKSNAKLSQNDYEKI